MSLPESVFAEVARNLFKFRYEVTIHVGTLVGGTPTDANVAEGWIRSKMGLTTDGLVKAEVERVMDERGVSADAAVEEVTRNRHLTGFKRDYSSAMARADQEKATTTGFVFEGKRKVFTPDEARRTFGELLIEGRQVKAMLKEALMICVGSGHIDGTKYGKTSKSAKGFFAEHAFVEEESISLGVTEPSRINQSFVHTFRGAGIKLEEWAQDVELSFTIISDFDFTTKDRDFWAKLFAMAEKNGLGASRSQGYGRFATIKFTQVESDPATTAKATRRVQQIREQEKILEAERAAGKAAKAADADGTGD